MGRWWIPRDYPQLLLVVLVGVLCLSITVAGATSTASFGTYNSKWDGASQLRDVAATQGTPATVVTDVAEYQAVEPSGAVAVVLAPETPYAPADRAHVAQFVREGGTLVVADDYGPHGNDLLAATGATTRVDGRPVRDERRYDASPAFPVADGVADHRYTDGVDALTLNHGSVLTTTNGTPVSAEATVLVNSSAYAYVDANHDGELDDDESLAPRPVAGVESVGDGHVIVVADPSAFINAMLDRPGNEQFIANVVGDHDRVLLDYSHVSGHPPLMAAALRLQKSSTLTALIGLLGVVVIGGVGGRLVRGSGFATVLSRLAPRTRSRQTGWRAEPQMDEEALTAYLRERHPDWEAERIKRVITGVIARREPGPDNE